LPSNVSESSSKEKEEFARADLVRQINEGNSWSGNERNCLFLNHGADRFSTASYVTGFDFKDDARGIALVDWDHDGDLDLWLSNRYGSQARYLENQTSGSRWLSLKLIGDGEKVNKDAIGAKVFFRIKDKGKEVPLKRSVACGDTFLSQSTKLINVGFGDAELMRIEVKWPDGRNQVFSAQKLNTQYVLRYGSEVMEEWKRPGKFGLPSDGMNEPSKPSKAIRLVHQYRLPPVVFFGENKIVKKLSFEKPTLLKFWSAECDICNRELGEIEPKFRKLAASGVELKLVNVDLDERGFPLYKKAKAPIMEQLSMAGQGVHVIEEFMNSLRIFNSEFQFPLGFLVDAHGNVISFYEGALNIDLVIKDSLRASKELNTRLENVIPYPGILCEGIAESYQPYIASRFANNKYEKYAETLIKQSDQQTQETIPYLLVLSDIYVKSKRGKKAIPHLEKVIEKATLRKRKKMATRLLGIAFMDSGNMENAQKYLEMSLKNYTDAEGCYYLAKLMHLTERKDKVEEYLKVSVDLGYKQRSKFELSWRHLSSIYKREKREKEREELEKRAMGLGIKL